MPPDRCRGLHFRRPDEVVGANCAQRSYTYDTRCETGRRFRDPTVACRVLQETCSCCASRYNLKSSLEPQGNWQSKVRVSDHKTYYRCSWRYWPCEFCCCLCDILTCAPLGLSLDIPSPLLGDGLCLVNRSPELRTYVGITVTSFGTSTYFSGRACPFNMSLRGVLWKNMTSSSFSL